MQALRYRPAAFWRLDDSSPFQDYSGYSRPGSLSGTETKGIALSSDALYSQFFDSTHTGTFQTNVYIQGKEAENFTLCAIVYPVMRTFGDTGPVTVLSHSGRQDGIVIDGTVIKFATEYSDGSLAQCSYDIQIPKKVSIVATHTEAKNSLFINGELVDEIDINETQQGLAYYSSSTNLISGQSSTTQGFLANDFLLFPRALNQDEVFNLHAQANVTADGDVPKMFGGETVGLSYRFRYPYLDTGWYSDSAWMNGETYQVDAEDGILYASKVDDVTLAGQWNGSVTLQDGETATAIESVNLYWEGQNETVSVSTDGETWTAATKNEPVSIISAGFVPTDTDLFIQVELAAGQEESYVSNLTVRGYLEDTTITANRVVTYTPEAIPLDEYRPHEFNDNWGVNLNGGTLTIGTDLISSSPDTIQTIEIWMKRTNSTQSYSGLTAGSTSYINGVASATVPVGEWIVRHYVKPAGFSTDISISGDIIIGQVSFYPTALTTQNMADILASYTGVKKSTTNDGATLAISEPTESTVIYAHDWEIQAV